MMKPIAAWCALLISCCVTAANGGSDLELLFKANQWFELRDAVLGTSAPPLYRGAVECAFNEATECEQDLRAAIKSAPHSEQAYEAHNILWYSYFRAGRYREALEESNAMLAIHPDNASDQAGRALLSALSQAPDQIVTQRGFSRIPVTKFVERPPFHGVERFIPVAINGKPAEYLLDSGAFSNISETEARRLGLTIREIAPSATKTYGVTGAEAGYRLAVANDLAVGNVHFKNVAFFVFPDGPQPSVLGLSVLIGLGTLRWNADGTLEIGFQPGRRNVRESNLCFDGPGVDVQIAFQHKKIALVLDTGAEATYLWPRFAADFPSVVKAGTKTSVGLTGLSGSSHVDAVTLPELTLQIGGFDAVLRPASVLLEKTTPESETDYGRLGSDLVNQAHRTTLDFESMTLTLD